MTGTGSGRPTGRVRFQLFPPLSESSIHTRALEALALPEMSPLA
ncbi:hypothetical protein ACIPIU_07735 [Streptomyces massasporeus]